MAWVRYIDCEWPQNMNFLKTSSTKFALHLIRERTMGNKYSLKNLPFSSKVDQILLAALLRSRASAIFLQKALRMSQGGQKYWIFPLSSFFRIYGHWTWHIAQTCERAFFHPVGGRGWWRPPTLPVLISHF